jgi:hypothetical protein
MWTSVADAASDSLRWRLTSAITRTNKSNKIVDVLLDFRNAVRIPGYYARFILVFRRRYGSFNGQQNRVSLTI